MKKYIFIVLLLPTLCFAEITDEIADGEVKSNQEHTMVRMTGINLDRIQGAFDKSKDTENIHHWNYSPNITYKINIREFMTTLVELPEHEKIESFVLGDKMNFQFSAMSAKRKGPLANKFQIYGIHPNADTNLTVVGSSGRIYSFYIRNCKVHDKKVPDLVIYLHDPTLKASKADSPVTSSEKDKVVLKDKPKAPDYLRSLPISNPSKLNFNYNMGV